MPQSTNTTTLGIGDKYALLTLLMGKLPIHDAFDREKKLRASCPDVQYSLCMTLPSAGDLTLKGERVARHSTSHGMS